jgi:hypothetical protein
VRHLVLDEADRLLETGNRPTIMAIFQRLRKDAAGDKRLQARPRPDPRARAPTAALGGCTLGDCTLGGCALGGGRQALATLRAATWQ